MNDRDSIVRPLVYFCYANPVGFSGQKAATELVMKGLAQRGWRCRPLFQPVMDRSAGRLLSSLRYLFGALTAWARAFALLFAGEGWLCVNLGQTRTAFLRDAMPLFLGRLGVGRAHIVISLHGSLFMQWPARSLNRRVFRFLLRQAGVVTVLGDRQRTHLIALGLPAERVQVVVNSCELEPLSSHEVKTKLSRATGADTLVRCLHLSSLIDTKGFPEYLEALREIASLPGPRIEAVLCGRLVASEFSDRFTDACAAEEWIEQQLTAINRSSRVWIRWIKGAVGPEKEALFRDADLFVLPTRYAVEAQPLVLLEAMASGCAIVTTRAGEIPTILDEESARFLPDPSMPVLAATLQVLVADGAKRLQLGSVAHTRFLNSYQMERHVDHWEKILGEPTPLTEAVS